MFSLHPSFLSDWPHFWSLQAYGLSWTVCGSPRNTLPSTGLMRWELPFLQLPFQFIYNYIQGLCYSKLVNNDHLLVFHPVALIVLNSSISRKNKLGVSATGQLTSKRCPAFVFFQQYTFSLTFLLLSQTLQMFSNVTCYLAEIDKAIKTIVRITLALIFYSQESRDAFEYFFHSWRHSWGWSRQRASFSCYFPLQIPPTGTH